MTRMVKRIERLPLGPIAALLLGGAVAFFCFAMPGEILERLVGASGLPDILPAAESPLGDTARALVAGAAGLAAFLAVLGGFVLSAIVTARPRRPKNEDAVEEIVPVRRSGIEEISSARRPLFAASDLGTPYELTDQLPKAEAEAEPEPVESVWRFEIEADALIEPVEATEPAPAPNRPLAAAPIEARVETIAALMSRLEAGLARRAARSTEGDAAITPIRSDVETPARSDDPLRDALDQLQRMARGR